MGRKKPRNESSDSSTAESSDEEFKAPRDGFRITADPVADAVEKAVEVESREFPVIAENEESNVRDDKARPRVVFLPRPDGMHEPAGVRLLRATDTIDIPNDFDSDDEQGDRNRIGSVPLWWYDRFKHVGYDLAGSKVTRQHGYSEAADLLKNADDPDAWRTVVDYRNQTTYRLTDDDLDLIQRIRSAKYPNASFDPEDSYVEFDNPDAAVYSHVSTLRSKKTFVPSRSDEKEINRIVKLIREGKLRRTDAVRKALECPDLWGASIFVDTEGAERIGPPPIAAPKLPLPGHAASYNPPEEFLYTDKQKEEFSKWAPEDDALGFIPQKYSCLRHVPLYRRNIHERFQRMLDLYLCPRSIKMRDNLDPESLLPILPKPQDLRPFPTRLTIEYTSDASDSPATAVSFDARGKYLAVGRHCGRLDVFDVRTSLLVFSWDVPASADEAPAQINCVEFNPTLPLLAVSARQSTWILVLRLRGWSKPRVTPAEDGSKRDEKDIPTCWDVMHALKEVQLVNDEGRIPKTQLESTRTEWISLDAAELTGDAVQGGWEIREKCTVTSSSWHPRGLYLVTICSRVSSPSYQIAIHALSRTTTLRPFRKCAPGKAQTARFHPHKPQILVQYYQSLRAYTLQPQDGVPAGSLVKKMKGMDHATCMAIHSSGEHVLTGGADGKVRWYDTAIGELPFKTFMQHHAGVKAVDFHRTYPLMLSAAVDGSVSVSYAKVYFDLLTNPTIVPVKILNARQDFGVGTSDGCYAARWHPFDPLLVVGMRSGKVGLYA